MDNQMAGIPNAPSPIYKCKVHGETDQVINFFTPQTGIKFFCLLCVIEGLEDAIGSIEPIEADISNYMAGAGIREKH